MRVLVFDAEVYWDFWCVSFLDPTTGKCVTFRSDLLGDGDLDRLKRIMLRNALISFNGNNYDVPIVFAMISGMSCSNIKRLSDAIIVGGLRPWDHEFPIPKPWDMDHIDLIEVAPGMVSLKLYAARLHVKQLEDLPYPAEEPLGDPEKIERVVAYNVKDLWATWELHKALEKQIELRVQMREMAGTDLRSKKDAQVASAVLKEQMKRKDGAEPSKSTIRPGYSFNYDPPGYLDFKTPEMQSVFADVLKANFIVSDSGKTLLPKTLEGRDVIIGGGVFRMGIGGLHSQEATCAHFSDENDAVIDTDADSFYPNMMLRLGLTPRHLGKSFLDVFGGIVATRLKAKREKNKVVADTLKIVVNSTFGMTGSRYSFLYDPKVMIQVTLTGQLLLLWLVDRACVANIRVVSANTDGIVVKLPRSRIPEWHAIVEEWRQMTGITTEETRYSALYSRDVNNYIAVKEDGEIKTKGAYSKPGPQKNPVYEICVTAAVKHITEGVPVDETIRACRDIRDFIAARTVQGGACLGDSDDAYLGKVVRWYMSKGSTSFIRTKKRDERTGNYKKVANTDGCRPLMDLPDDFPSDIDYDRYIEEAESILRDVGFYGDIVPKPKQIRLTKKNKIEVLSTWAVAP